MIRRIRRIPDIIFETDNLILLLIGIGVGLAASIFAPALRPYIEESVPYVQDAMDIGEVRCSNLAPPQGGYQRSMLAVTGEGVPDLKVDVGISQRELSQGDELRVDVIFSNNDNGPVILFIPENDILVANSGANVGITVEFLNIITGQTLTYGIPATAIPNEASFRDTQLHLLRAHNRCSQSYELDVPLNIGEYTVRAIYANTRAGLIEPRPNETIDPGITDQGVWSSSTPIESETLRLSVNPPATATLAPAQ